MQHTGYWQETLQHTWVTVTVSRKSYSQLLWRMSHFLQLITSSPPQSPQNHIHHNHHRITCLSIFVLRVTDHKYCPRGWMEIPLICGNASVVILDKIGRCALVTGHDMMCLRPWLGDSLTHHNTFSFSKRVILFACKSCDYFMGPCPGEKTQNISPVEKIRITVLCYYNRGLLESGYIRLLHCV